MNRFILFVSRTEELQSFSREFPDVDFRFVSYKLNHPSVVYFDRNNYEYGFAKLLAEHNINPFSGVLNIREKYVMLASLLAQKLGLRPIIHNPLLARDKFCMRQALSKATQPIRSFLISHKDDLKQIPDDLYPCVMKPRFGFNSRCVEHVQNRRQLEHAFIRNQRYYSIMKREDCDNVDFIVEEFIQGSEHTVEALVKDGEIVLYVVSDKDSMQPPYFVEVGDIMPSRLSAEQSNLVVNAARLAVKSLNIQNSWSHIEVKLFGNTVTIVEVASRMGGGYFGRMIEKVYGINRLRMLLNLHLSVLSMSPINARTTVIGRRIVVNGLVYVTAIRDFPIQSETNSDVCLIWPSSTDAARRLVIGPPFGYKNTVLEFFITHIDPDEAQRIAKRIGQTIRVVSFSIPSIFGEAVWRVSPLILIVLRKKGIDI